MKVDLYPHQSKAIKEMHNGCILTGDVGSGKTITSLAYFYTRVAKGQFRTSSDDTFKPMAKPRNIYVFTTARKRNDLDWYKDAAKFGISPDPESSIPGVTITVDSWNNIHKYKDVKNSFIIFDEQRLVGNGSWVKNFLQMAKNNQWIILSATPGDNWMDYIPVFVAHGWYKNRTEFIRTHVVWKPYSKFPKVDRYVDTNRLLNLRKRLLVAMPFARHTTRHIKNIPVVYDEEKMNRVIKDRWNVYKEQPLKHAGELFATMRRVANEDPSRLVEIVRLLKKHPRLIIFYNFDYELEILRTLEEEYGFPVFEWNGHRHDPVPTGDRWAYLVQYTAGAEAWNCITTDAIAFYSLNYSYKVNHQAKGRIDRLDTPYKDLYYYILRSNAKIDQMIIKALHLKKNFNEKDAEKEFGNFDDIKPAPMSMVEERINRLRRQVLVHSIIYYRLGTSVIDDSVFDSRARELAQLQKDHPKQSENVEYMREAFRDFTGETGYHLPLDDERAYNVALEIVLDSKSNPDASGAFKIRGSHHEKPTDLEVEEVDYAALFRV